MILVGGSVAVSGHLVDYPVLTAQALRYAVAAVLLYGFAKWTRRFVRPTRRELARLSLLGLVGLAGFNVFLVLALRHAEPASVGVVVGCVPLAWAVLAPLRVRARVDSGLVLAAGAVVVGAAVVQGSGQATPLGLGFAAAALLAEVAFTLLAVPLLPRLGASTVSTIGCCTAAVELVVFAPVLHGSDWLSLPSPTELGAMVFLALAVTAIAFVLWYDAVARLGSEVAGLFAGLVPVSALVAGWLVGLGTVHPRQVLGTIVVGAAITLGLRRGS